jgi:hypothetical protein
LRILFDKNVPAGVRHFLSAHEVRTFIETGWDVQLENGELLKVAEAEGFEVLVTADQNIRYQQNLTDRSLSLIVLGSNIWPIVRGYARAIVEAVERSQPRSYEFVEMLVPPRPRTH